MLAWTGYSMIVREPLLASWFEAHPATKLVAAILFFSISLAPWYTRAPVAEQLKPLVVLLPALLVWLLGFEVAASVWKLQVDYLLATRRAIHPRGRRWLGWLAAPGCRWLSASAAPSDRACRAHAAQYDRACRQVVPRPCRR